MKQESATDFLGFTGIAALDELLSSPLPAGAEALLRTFDLNSPGRRSIYVSTPITTGQRYLDWIQEPGSISAAEIKSAVMAENLEALQPLNRMLALVFPKHTLIDPTRLNMDNWQQRDYHRFWLEVIGARVDRLVLADGWQYSTGCVYEFGLASILGIELLDARLRPLSAQQGCRLLKAVERSAVSDSRTTHMLLIRALVSPLQAVLKNSKVSNGLVFKDTGLTRLSSEHNVASFASFTPGEPRVRYLVTPAHSGAVAHEMAVEKAVAAVMESSVDRRVNVRTFSLEQPQGMPFHYGLDNISDVVRIVRSAAAEGTFTIVNETISVHDGGVSGVTQGGIVEFAPDSTPRTVETSDPAALPLGVANAVLSRVYGFPVELPARDGVRFEFSIHPGRVGIRGERVCVWEEVESERGHLAGADIRWPNAFSRLIGDKTFGLLIGDAFGAPVPRTTVITRRLAPFTFGRATSTQERWLRTAPSEQTPGFFTTVRGWVDPFALLKREDPEGKVAAVLSQDAVDALYSGASRSEIREDYVEGVAGAGDQFMSGNVNSGDVPDQVIQRVRQMTAQLQPFLGPVRTEWAFDGSVLWLLQLHRQGAPWPTGSLSPGEAKEWVPYDPASGLERLYDLVASLKGSDIGVVLTRPVGVTSHVGDVLRKARVPARFAGSVFSSR